MASQRVMETIRWTRAVAVADQRGMILCATVDGANCVPFSAGVRQWIAKPDDSAIPDRQIAVPSILRVEGTAGRSGIRFESDGTAAGSNLTLKLCDSSGTWLHSLIISNGGRVRRENQPAAGPCAMN